MALLKLAQKYDLKSKEVWDMLKRWLDRLPDDSIFRKPLVFEITLVLLVKIILLIVLWQIAFKPLKPATPPSIDTQLLPSTLTKESTYD